MMLRCIHIASDSNCSKKAVNAQLHGILLMTFCVFCHIKIYKTLCFYYIIELVKKCAMIKLKNVDTVQPEEIV